MRRRRLGQGAIEGDADRLATLIARFVPLSYPLTSTSWDGDAYSTTARTLIDLSAVFGAPAGIKAALIQVAIRDSSSASNDCYLILSPRGAGGGVWVDCSGLADDHWERNQLIIPCDPNGDIYYQIIASGSDTMDIYLQIWGYWL